MHYDPIAHALRLGVLIIETSHPTMRSGGYLHRANLIILSAGLSELERRCTLAHELAHAVFGDIGTHWRSERRARRTAASWLIDRADYERAACMFEGDPRLIANELDVTLDVLEDYVRLVLREAA